MIRVVKERAGCLCARLQDVITGRQITHEIIHKPERCKESVVYDSLAHCHDGHQDMSRIILTVHKFFPAHKAGTEVLTLKIAQQLQARGHEVLVVTANPPDVDARYKAGPATSDYTYEGIPVHVVEESMRLAGSSFHHEYYHPQIKSHFAKLIESFKPDLLHIVHAQNLSASIIEAACEADLPIVCSATDFWFVCPVVQLKRPDGAICRGPNKVASNCLTCYTPKLFAPVAEFRQAIEQRFMSVKSLMAAVPEVLRSATYAGLYGVYAASKLKAAISATRKRPAVLRDLANKTDAIMVPTQLMFDIFAENGINTGLLQKVGFGIDTAPLESYQTKTASEQVRIGYIGTLFEHKGVDLLIDAFQNLPNNYQGTLTIYGDPQQFPEYGSKLMQLAKRNFPNSAKITFAGTFPNSSLGEVLRNIDVLVVPSRWYENTPLVMQSALATKTPLVVTNLGGMSELVKHEENGLLFNLNDAQSLKQQLERLDKKPNGLLRRMTDNIKPERTMTAMVDDIEKVYARVQAKRKAASAGGLACSV